MADDLQITPQGDEPANTGSGDSPGGYKFDPAEAGVGMEENGKINLAGGENPAPIHGLIGASTEKEGEIIAPMKLETETSATEPAVEATKVEERATEERATDSPAEEKSSMMETSPATESTEDVSTEESLEEAPAEETPAEPTPKKKGLPKAALIGGALFLAMVIGAGAYYGLGGLFKGKLTDDQLRQAAVEGLCPTDTYYDATTMLSPTYQPRDKEITDLSITRTPLERNYAARDFGRAQFISDAIQPIAQPITTTTLAPSISTDMLDTKTTTTTITTTSDSGILNLDTINTSTNNDLVINAESNDVLVTDKSLLDADHSVGDTIDTDLASKLNAPESAQDATLADQLDTGEMTIATPLTDATLADQIDSSDMSKVDALSLTLTNFATEGMTIAALSTDATVFDPSMCKPIPRDDCALLDALKNDPTKFFLSELTLSHVDNWIATCKIEPIDMITCGTNQELVQGVCACSAGYFDISSAKVASADIRIIDSINTDTKITCVNCDELNEMIIRLTEDLNSPLVDKDTTALEKELTALKAIAAENCVQEETPIVTRECPENQVRNATGDCVCAEGYEMNVDGVCTLLQKPVSTVCGDNQITQRDGTCACVDGFFDISSASSTDVRMTDLIGTKTTLQCVNCDQLNQIITKKSAELDNPLRTTDTVALEAEITKLKAIAAENCPVEAEPERDILPDPEIVTVVEKYACEQFANNAEAQLARGDVMGSYDAVIEYIKNDCGRTYNDCEEYLAIAKTAKEYSSIASTLSPASVSYFDDLYTRNRRAFYSNPACVNTADLCVEVKSEEPINDRILIDTTEEPSVELLTGDRSTSDMLMIDSTSEEPLTLEKLQRDVDYYISVKGIEDEKEKEDYITLYCPEEEVVITREEPAPVRDVVAIVEEEPAPVRDVVAIVEEEPAPVRLVPITVSEEPITSPPASGTRDSEPTAVLAASEEQPIAGGSVSKPIAGGTVSPATTAPATETAAVASDTFVASTTTTSTTTTTTETVSPATTTPDLRPAATVATPDEPTLTSVDPAQPAPLITAETAPPEIHPVGPEVIMYAFALIASQLYFFRRRIMEFVMNR